MEPSTGWLLAAALVLVIVGIVFLTAKYKVNAFLVLLLASFAFGAIAFAISGNPPLLDVKTADGKTIDGLVTVVTKGFGGTLTAIGIVILFGTIIGYILEKSGAAFVMAESVLKFVGRSRAPLAIGIVGYIVSIPVFCDSGFIILSALNRALAMDAGISLSVMATSLSMGLYTTHTMVPPTPGPLAAAGNLGADIGLVILFGLIAALPAMLVGVFFAKRYASRFHINPQPKTSFEQIKAEYGQLTSPFLAFMPIVVPVVLIGLASVANLQGRPFGDGVFKAILNFIGHPVISLAIGILLALLTVPRFSRDILDSWVGNGIKDAAIILVITAAGGSLGAVIKATGLGDFLGKTMSTWNLGLLLPFVIAAAIKTAQGSSTVSLVTTSAIMAPLLGSMGWTSSPAKALVTIAIGAGSMVVSHANDSYFWVVSQFSDMDVPTAYRCQTLGTLVVGVVSIVTILLMSLVAM